MRILVINHKYHYEMEKLVRIFFPNEKIEVVRDGSVPAELLTAVDDEITVSANFDGFSRTLTAPLCDDNEMQMGRMVYTVMSEYTGFYPKWGVLTGVRPSKLLIATDGRLGRDKTEDYFKNDLLVSDEKFRLARTVADCEEKIISTSRPESYSLYISVPFCPSRCSYCSFVSHSVESVTAKRLLPQYAELLNKELEYTGKIARQLGLRLESVYVGGGTPTTFSAGQLSLLLDTVNNNFDMSRCREFTVEAGRPDTITAEKLTTIKNGGADRISINPQTFSDAVLSAVGRRHSADDTVRAFSAAREMGFDNINMDLIAGLPSDTADGFCRSLDRAVSLSPENITVHTLAVKRSSAIGMNSPETAFENAKTVSDMLDYTYKTLGTDYMPYYMYRQSKSVGSLENTGWCREGRECIYNIFMMEECHTILACGGGAVTKLKAPHSSELERVFNFKYPYEYASGFDTLLKRKKRITEFYNTYSVK